MAGLFILVVLLVGGLLLLVRVALNLIGLYLMREINGFELMIILAVFVGLSLGAISGGGVLAFLLLMWLIGLTLPIMGALHNRHKLQRMTRDDIRAYEEGLRRQPDVPYPHRRLGDIYYERGDWDSAVEHYEAYLRVHNLDAYVSNRLERVLMFRRREQMGLRTCPVCGAECPGNAARCEQCGFYLKGSRELLDVLSTPEMMRIWRWVMIAFVVPGIILGLARDGSPVLGAIMLCLSAAATIFYIYGRVTQRERSNHR